MVIKVFVVVVGDRCLSTRVAGRDVQLWMDVEWKFKGFTEVLNRYRQEHGPRRVYSGTFLVQEQRHPITPPFGKARHSISVPNSICKNSYPIRTFKCIYFPSNENL